MILETSEIKQKICLRLLLSKMNSFLSYNFSNRRTFLIQRFQICENKHSLFGSYCMEQHHYHFQGIANTPEVQNEGQISLKIVYGIFVILESNDFFCDFL